MKQIMRIGVKPIESNTEMSNCNVLASAVPSNRAIVKSIEKTKFTIKIINASTEIKRFFLSKDILTFTFI